MNRKQYEAMLKDFGRDKKNLAKYLKKYKYAYILSDGIFKIVFASDDDHELLISLVNAMLDLHGDAAIKSIKLEMQEYPGVLNKKTCILDIIGTTNAGEKVLVEIQQNSDTLFRDRVEETCRGKAFFPKIQKIFVEVNKFFKLEKRGLVKHDDSDAAQWLRAIKSLMDEKPMPGKLLKNPIFLKLQNEVKLCNFTDEVFNAEVCNMTDLKYEHECGYIEGREEGLAEGREEARREYEARIRELEKALSAKKG